MAAAGRLRPLLLCALALLEQSAGRRVGVPIEKPAGVSVAHGDPAPPVDLVTSVARNRAPATSRGARFRRLAALALAPAWPLRVTAALQTGPLLLGLAVSARTRTRYEWATKKTIWKDHLKSHDWVDFGSFSDVYVAKMRRCGSFVAIKHVRLKHGDRVEREIRALKAFGGGDVIKFYGALAEDAPIRDGGPAVNLFMEAADSTVSTAVFAHLDQPLVVSEDVRLRMLVELLRGLSKLESRGWVHRNVQPSNLLLFGDCTSAEGCHLKVGGLGEACPVAEADPRRAVGHPMYLAPELLRREPDPSKCDVWSAGLVAFQLFAGRIPETLSEWDTDEDLRGLAADHNLRHVVSTLDISRDELFEHLVDHDAEIAGLVGEMLTNDAEARPSMAEALVRAQRIASSRGVSVPEQADAPHVEIPRGEQS